MIDPFAEIVTLLQPAARYSKMVLGAGRSAVADLGIETIADARHLVVTDVTTVGEGTELNVRITMTPHQAPAARTPEGAR